jgi:uncharacterized protein YecT (DUF1311 family)
MQGRVVTFCALLTVSSCMTVAKHRADHARVPWLDQPIHQLGVLHEGQEQQQEMNYTISDLCILRDAKLCINLHVCLETLDGQAREAAVLEQEEWLETRLERVALAGGEHPGGTLRPFVAGRAFIDPARARTAGIMERMDRTASDTDIPKRGGRQ